MTSERILVMGGSGFIGTAAAREAMRRGAEVVLLNRGTRRVPGTTQLCADRNNSQAVHDALRGLQFDIVLDTNCYSPTQVDILVEAIGFCSPRVVVISSASVYVDPVKENPTEDSLIGGAPVWGGYGRDKTLVERAYARHIGTLESCSIVRPPYVFGPKNNFDRETWFWSRQFAGIPVVLPGSGDTCVQFIHVDDLANALLEIASSGRCGLDVFNVADPKVLTFAELATLLASVVNLPDRQICAREAAAGLTARDWFPFRDFPCLAPPTHLSQVLGWAPRQDLRKRLSETAAAYSLQDLARAATCTQAEALLLRRVVGPT